MPRFNFPIPSRKQKAAAATNHPPVSITLTKAQRILGSADLNVDSRPGYWDQRSSSGISISISETDSEAAAYAESRSTLGRVPEDRAVKASKAHKANDAFEEESSIIPRTLDKYTRGNREQGGAEFHDALTDASSVRRRQSSSTIASYYDKSKQPLSISQQTSASAMAKGPPPSQPSMLFGLGGNSPSPSREKKKKPTRLDLSHLLPRVRSTNKGTGGNVVLGPDMMTKSPSVMSESPDFAPPPIKQRSDRGSPAKRTKESLRERKSTLMTAPDTTGARSAQAQAQAQVNALHSLYSHYEQRSFRDVVGRLDELQSSPASILTPLAESPIGPPTPVKTPVSNQGLLTPSYTASNIRGNSKSSHASPAAHSSGPETPVTALLSLSPPGLISPSADCAASVSSRHTRTSKASRRTTQSGFEMDLKQNSVLSLSSDSEEDFVDTPAKSSVSIPEDSPRQPRLDALPPVPVRRLNNHPTTGQSSHFAVSTPANRQKRTKGRDAPTRPVVVVPKPTNLTPSPPAPLKAPAINPRKSSLVTQANPRHSRGGLPSSSRLSIQSDLTINSVASGPIPNQLPFEVAFPSPPKSQTAPQSAPSKRGPVPSSYGSGFAVHEARAITMVPAQSKPSSSSSPSSPSSRRAGPMHEHGSSSHLSISISSTGDQPTPPLSPTSVDFYLRSQHSSAMMDKGGGGDGEEASLRSSRSKGGGGAASPSAASSTSSRFMAVTRQEEMLLAALRLKRARMRETIIAEFEEEERERVMDSFPAPGGVDQHGHGRGDGSNGGGGLRTESSSSMSLRHCESSLSNYGCRSSISTVNGGIPALSPRPQRRRLSGAVSALSLPPSQTPIPTPSTPTGPSAGPVMYPERLNPLGMNPANLYRSASSATRLGMPPTSAPRQRSASPGTSNLRSAIFGGAPVTTAPPARVPQQEKQKGSRQADRQAERGDRARQQKHRQPAEGGGPAAVWGHAAEEEAVARHERVLMYLDSPVRRSDGFPHADAFDEPEPSPDLSDFMGFDDDGLSADSVLSRALDDRSPLGHSRAGANTAAQHDLHHQQQQQQHHHHHRTDDPTLFSHDEAVGTSRPDSPVSPAQVTATASVPLHSPMPRKKAVRISAVGGPGRVGMEVGWWGDDG